MSRTLKAAAFYFICVFAIGFVLGTVRTLFLVPHIGEILAVCAELPIILPASWTTCRFALRRFPIDERISVRFAMGAVAFLLLMCAEFALSALVFRRATSEYFLSFASAAGILGLAGQIAFALFPVVQSLLNEKKS